MTSYQGSGDPSLSEGLGKRLMTPGGAVAPAPAPELFGCIVLENDRPEMAFLKNEGLYARAAGIGAGGAGTRSSAQLVNPFGSDSLVVVEAVTANVASGLVLILTPVYLSAVLPVGTRSRGTARDTRSINPATGQPRTSQSLVIVDNTLSLVGGSTQAIRESLSVSDQKWVLGPGGALYVAPNADNVAISYVTFFWRERRLNPSERI